MKKCLILALSCLLVNIAFASTDPVSFGYLKLGTEGGVGYRRHEKAHGIDLSANFTTVIKSSWLSGKVLYLNYPFYDHNRYFYLGVGAGAVNQWDLWFGLLMGGVDRQFYPSLEGIIGYEFHTDKNSRTFLQLEGTVPLSKTDWAVLPALTFGVGF